MFVALAMVVFLPDSSRVRTCRACGEARRPGSCPPAEPPRQRPEIPEKKSTVLGGFFEETPMNIIGMSTVLYINWWQDFFLQQLWVSFMLDERKDIGICEKSFQKLSTGGN